MPDIKLIASLQDIDPSQWNAWAGGHPFMRHEFLSLLHETGCASDKTGWAPRYLGLWHGQTLAGAMPLYLKSHSWGEYVFDHQWARAFTRHGMAYYPKLLCAAPFTPVTGPRLLAATPEDRRLLAQGAIALAERSGVSSLHILFPNADDRAILSDLGFLLREGVQFHWRNAGYASLNDFLAALNHGKRKNIRHERRRVQEAGISFLWLHGNEISQAQLEFFYRCYANTYQEHGSLPYLSLDFFGHLARALPDQWLWIMAMSGAKPIACALNARAGDTLYGRYWGAPEFVSGLHFETCYTQAIEYCIQQRLSVFEGGAQGLHKLSRGLLPTSTWSAHWIADPRFAEAIGRFLEEESQNIEHYREELEARGPFKRT